MSNASEVRMNVAALKRVDPYVKDILETAKHVALYTFNSESSEWEKTEIEGALFVYSRIGEPFHSILIMNRLNTKNQVEPVTPGLDLQLQEPFLLYKNARGSIYGIWFYDKDDCVKISNILNKLAKESESSADKVNNTPKNTKTVPVQQQHPQQQQQQQQQQIQRKPNNNIDIFSMLSKAQQDYKSNKTGHASGNNINANVNNMSTPITCMTRNNDTVKLKSPMSNAIGAFNAMSIAPDVTSKSVMDFFAKAKVNTGQFKAGDQPHPPSNIIVNEGKPILARLMSMPAAHTLEHIEQQQRSTTPQNTIPTNSQAVLMPINNQCSSNTQIKNKIQQDYQSRINSSAMMSSDISTVRNQTSETNNSTGFLRIQSPKTINAKNIESQKTKNVNIPGFSWDRFDAHKQEKNNSVANNTMSFDAVYVQNATTNNICETTPVTPSSSGPALIPPVMFAAPSPAVAEISRPIEPLTRNQLLQAFNYLIKNDPEFVNKLHEAYVKSFSEILN